MIHDLLRPEYPGINHNRIYRLYSEAGRVNRRKVKSKRYGERVPPIQAEKINQILESGLLSATV